jgi:hypothetical protein
MDKWVRIISTSSGVRITVEAADALTWVGFGVGFGVGFSVGAGAVAGNDCVLCFFARTTSSSFEDERRQSADLMRLGNKIRFEKW